MEDKENDYTTSSLVEVAAVRHNLTLSNEIHSCPLGSGSVFDFAFASCDSMFSDCKLKLYIEDTMEEAWDVEGPGEAPDFTESSGQCSSSQTSSHCVSHSRGMFNVTWFR